MNGKLSKGLWCHTEFLLCHKSQHSGLSRLCNSMMQQYDAVKCEQINKLQPKKNCLEIWKSANFGFVQIYQGYHIFIVHGITTHIKKQHVRITKWTYSNHFNVCIASALPSNCFC